MIPNAYRVSNWNALYENNRTKEIKRLLWVPVPNSMDGAGYTELVDHPNGAAHFGAWIAILEIASRQEVRGEIPQSSAGTSQALARISRLPVSVFDEVFPRLISLQWVELTGNQQLGGNPQEGAGLSQERAGNLPLKEGIEQNGKKHTAPKSGAVDAWFESDFWPVWTKAANDSKGAALKAARAKVKDRETQELVIEGARRQRKARLAQDPQYRSHAATWLNQSRWIDGDEEAEEAQEIHRPLPPPKFWVDDLLDPK